MKGGPETRAQRHADRRRRLRDNTRAAEVAASARAAREEVSLEQIREALEPFARFAAWLDFNEQKHNLAAGPDESSVYLVFFGDNERRELLAKDFRRARTALDQLGG